ncbi:DNA mismatch repair protein MutL [uncultured Desulfobacterium sp.]|uniref:DNA mismatch repair protein MutL n=1 Tax=uncultured Desulfobacterium sp. TaxID=201089 RepID=A0A445N3C2_9BACT|nr:DNA mismatch repair protein MutL [uncultured Desulfobacterium sp.]
MNTIRILPENVASQIAAGEVIDRPASVVRELLDNSIDAGSERIAVKVEGGGKSLIRVSDNGVGMTRDDLLLCIERHATSKIRTASDLYTVSSLGFRGEAIPSIGSVSRLEITSRPKDQLGAFRLKMSGGKLTAVEETGGPAGTTVEVRDLFFNIPVRRNFMRSANTELDYIIETFSRSALPYFGVSFKLEDSTKTILNFPASGRPLDRLFSLLGRKVTESMILADEAAGDLTLKLYLAPPELNRTRADRLYVYVNRRNIRDNLITKAIFSGYGQRLMKGRYPQAVVFVEIEPSKVDVNIHPTKQEVRFHNSRAVFDTIASAIEKALSHSLHPFVFPSQSADKEETSHETEPAFFSVAEPRITYKTKPDYLSLVETIKTDQQIKAGVEHPEAAMVKEPPSVIGQLGGTYILCQGKDGLIMVDQHAAHERVVYENLKKGINKSHIEVQALLLPIELELSAKEARIAVEKAGLLADIGIEVDHFGGNSFLLRAHPAILKDVNWDSFFSELLACLYEGRGEKESLLDNVLTVMACHGAVRAGDRMSLDEMALLLDQLEATALPTNCPHGRPVSRLITYHEIEKMFKRIV